MTTRTRMFDTEPLRKAMALKGWRQDDLASATGLSGGAVSKVLNGHTSKSRTVKRLADALDVDMKALVDSPLPTANCQLPTATPPDLTAPLGEPIQTPEAEELSTR